MKKARSAGYSDGSGSVGFESFSALSAAVLNEPMAHGRTTCRSRMDPSLRTLKVMTTRPYSNIALVGMSQLRLSWAMNRRIHGPNSTPFASNWMSGSWSVSPPRRLSKF